MDYYAYIIADGLSTDIPDMSTNLTSYGPSKAEFVTISPDYPSETSNMME